MWMADLCGVDFGVGAVLGDVGATWKPCGGYVFGRRWAIVGHLASKMGHFGAVFNHTMKPKTGENTVKYEFYAKMADVEACGGGLGPC